MASQEKFDQFIDELKECAAGRRGWVDCSIKRANEIGLRHSNLTVAAKAAGLKIEKHGKYGYTASK